MDIISTLPPGPIETILCLLPIQEAARTSILSKEWKYHWTKIPKLAFIEDMFQVSTDQDEYYEAPNQRKTMTKRCKFFNAIYQVLLMHEGPIHEFVLSVYADDSCVEIDQIMFHLSRKYAVKKLTLELTRDYLLPKNLFSLHQLTDLCLIGCNLFTRSTLDGFGSLTSLRVQQGEALPSTLLKLLSYYPQLKCADIRALGMEDSGDTIINLFKCFPLIENLSMCFWIIQSFADEGVPRELPLTLVHLKYLYIENTSLVHEDGLPILALLIRSSPNLEKLKIEVNNIDDACINISDISGSFALEDCLDIGLEHLNELEIVDMTYKKTHLDFVKLILAKSPVLKKVTVFLNNEVANDEEFEISIFLLSCQRASPSVEITIGIVAGSCTWSSRNVM